MSGQVRFRYPYLPQVYNKAVSFVEAAPGHLHLSGSDGPPALDVQQTLHIYIIGQHVMEAGRNPTLLRRRERLITLHKTILG